MVSVILPVPFTSFFPLISFVCHADQVLMRTVKLLWVSTLQRLLDFGVGHAPASTSRPQRKQLQFHFHVPRRRRRRAPPSRRITDRAENDAERAGRALHRRRSGPKGAVMSCRRTPGGGPPRPMAGFCLCPLRCTQTQDCSQNILCGEAIQSCLRRSGDPFRAVPAWWLAHAPPIIGVRPGRSCPLLCCCSLLPHNRNVYVPGHHHCIWHWRYCLLFLGDRKKEKCASNSIC